MRERPRFVPHDQLDPDVTQALAEFATPRRCGCEHWLWPVDEIEVRELDALRRHRHHLAEAWPKAAGAGADTGMEVAP